MSGVTLAKPNIGDLRKGLGKNKYNWFCWSACESCGKERWVQIRRGKLRNSKCVQCSDHSKATEAMRMANLGATRSQAIRDKISQTRQQRDWEYAKIPPQNPTVGDKARLGRRWCVWAVCSMCGKERWVRVKRGGIPSHTTCNKCATDEKRNKLRLANIGLKHSPERIEANRLAQIGKVISEETRRKISMTSMGREHTEEAKRKLSKSQKQLWANPDFKAKTLKILWEATHTPQAKANKKAAIEKAMRIKWKDYINVGLSRVSIQELKSNDIGDVGDIVMVRGKSSSSAIKIRCVGCDKAMWVRLEKGLPRSTKCHSCASSVMWKQYPDIFGKARLEKWMKAMRHSLHMRPNQVEKRLLQILNKLYPNEWAFVGDWSLIIANKNPDFVNINGKKQVIELFGDYWHKGQKPEKRIALFRKFGYQTLVVWERELKDETLLTKRIQEFVG